MTSVLRFRRIALTDNEHVARAVREVSEPDSRVDRKVPPKLATPFKFCDPRTDSGCAQFLLQKGDIE